MSITRNIYIYIFGLRDRFCKVKEGGKTGVIGYAKSAQPVRVDKVGLAHGLMCL